MRVIFIGNRPAILSALLDIDFFTVIHCFVIKGSLIESNTFSGVLITQCDLESKNDVVSFLKDQANQYDLCVTAGCPFIIPVDELPKNKIFINVHPSALPLGRGINPINECILNGHNKLGASVHYLTSELDAGPIIYQEIFDITDEIDLDLLYSFIFEFESEVFSKAMGMLIANNFRLVAKYQPSKGTYYSRKNTDINVNIIEIGVTEFLRKVRAFSTNSLGLRFSLKDRKFIVYKATHIQNTFLINRYNKSEPGSIALEKGEVLLVSMKDGLVRLDKWLEVE